MGGRKYPRPMPAQWSVRRAMIQTGICGDCGSEIPIGGAYAYIETQVSWFRGDDEVDILCPACAKKRGIKSPPAAAVTRGLRGDRNHYCDVCGRGFHSNESAAQHKKDKHGSQP